MLKSSIIGKEFVNYRKTTLKQERLKFSERIRLQGIGCIPIVIDSVDKEISNIFSVKERGRGSRKYGKEIVLHMDKKVSDVLKEVKIILLQNDEEEMVKNNILQIGLEDGSLPEQDCELGTLYKKYRNKDDKILYLLVTKETSVYGYIKSILSYLMNNVGSFISGTFERIHRS